jgi:hypothetical protein
MMTGRVAAFDIETIPDPDVGRRILGLHGTDGEVVREMVRLRLEQTGGRSEYPVPPWHRVVAVCVAVLDPAGGPAEIRALGGEALDERSHVEGFFGFVGNGGEEAVQLVSWNGGGFDLPVLRYRAMMLGVAAPEFYRREGDWRWNNYQSRYHDLHIDLMDVLSGYGASARVGLRVMAESLGLPAKKFLDRPIYEHVLESDHARVIEYCKLDTVTTLLAFLVWRFHCGQSSAAELVADVERVRAGVGRLEFAGWREIETCLTRWPPWAVRPSIPV